MDTGVVIALISASSVVGGAITGPVVARIMSRRITAAQVEQIRTQTDLIRQDIYQQLTEDLRAELARVRTDLDTTRESLRITSAEEERLRQRVLELESRVAELATVRDERDRLRIDVAAREATIVELQRQVADLRVQLASMTTVPAPTT